MKRLLLSFLSPPSPFPSGAWLATRWSYAVTVVEKRRDLRGQALVLSLLSSLPSFFLFSATLCGVVWETKKENS